MSSSGSNSFMLPIPGQVPVAVKIDTPSRSGSGTPTLILAHGASNNLDYPLIARLATHLAGTESATVVRFNFPYVERGVDSPDCREVLGCTMLAVYDHVRNHLETSEAALFVGGKSLGACTAAELVSHDPEEGGVDAAGLILLGYPLHTPGREDHLFLEPLRRIAIPSLFFAGTLDPFCNPKLLRPLLGGLAHPADLHIIEGADHSLQLAHKAEREARDTYGEIADQVEAFIANTAE